MALNMCGKNCDCNKPVDEKFKFEYKRYYHVLLPTENALLCLGSNEPGHQDCTVYFAPRRYKS